MRLNSDVIRRMKITIELTIAVLSALAALGSAYWAWNSARTARRALALSEEDATTKREALSAYLINALRWENESDEYTSFSCSYTNGSSYPTTIERIDLIVHGFDMGGNGSQIQIQPEDKTPEGSDFSVLQTPINFQARTSTSGWLNFRIPKHWVAQFIIDKYELVATTWSGQKVTLESHIVMKQSRAP